MDSSSSIIFFRSNLSATTPTPTPPPQINPPPPPKIPSFTAVSRSRTCPPLPASNFISPQLLFHPEGWYTNNYKTPFPTNQEQNQPKQQLSISDFNFNTPRTQKHQKTRIQLEDQSVLPSGD
ncbi:U-box domain-containing protein 30-like [Pyrus ussuriensis x Pyrus communis]|uniref:U-box domain-containing protein 30-like n=1 Tax=Pyrus ussuriensis x Pyrus communis TaxID=2448454 RepID=A0A5N5HLH1_9ROSA|nr:U-box domain-containing protein 30-like [Pyrus ussuriensis x Pyrus communis]